MSFKEKIKPEDLSPLYLPEIPKEPGYYYVALLSGSFQWECEEPTYEEIIMLSSGEGIDWDEDDNETKSSDWWYCDFYLSEKGMLSNIKGYQRGLVGPRVKSLNDLNLDRKPLICDPANFPYTQELIDDTFFCDGGINKYKEGFKKDSEEIG